MDLNKQTSHAIKKEIKRRMEREEMGSTEMSHLQNCSVKIFKEHCRSCTIKNQNKKTN